MAVVKASMPNLPRRKTFCGHSVARDYYTGWVLLFFIPSVVLIAVRWLLFSEELVGALSYSAHLRSFCVVFFLTVAAELLLFLIMVADPGILPYEVSTAVSHLCPVCGVVVDDYDHHCGFLGACIGKGTMKYFVAFSICATLLCATGFYLALCFVAVGAQQTRVRQTLSTHWQSVFPLLVHEWLFCFRRFLSVAVAVLCFYAGTFSGAIAAIHLYACFSGTFSLVRRRNRELQGSIRDVFAGFFHPVFARDAMKLLGNSKGVV